MGLGRDFQNILRVIVKLVIFLKLSQDTANIGLGLLVLLLFVNN